MTFLNSIELIQIDARYDRDCDRSPSVCTVVVARTSSKQSLMLILFVRLSYT